VTRPNVTRPWCARIPVSECSSLLLVRAATSSRGSRAGESTGVKKARFARDQRKLDRHSAFRRPKSPQTRAVDHPVLHRKGMSTRTHQMRSLLACGVSDSRAIPFRSPGMGSLNCRGFPRGRVHGGRPNRQSARPWHQRCPAEVVVAVAVVTPARSLIDAVSPSNCGMIWDGDLYSGKSIFMTMMKFPRRDLLLNLQGLEQP